MAGFVAKIGSVFAVALSIAVAIALRKWDFKETATYNIVHLVMPFVMPHPRAFRKKSSLEAQAAYLAAADEFVIKTAGSEATIKTFGEDCHRASFGETATRLANFTIPSTHDPDHGIPVVCACPYDSTAESKLPLVFYFFGGGLIMGSIERELPLSRWLAADTNAVVCSIGYRLAVLNPYPTPINDVIDASVAILEQKTSVEASLGVGIDYGRIATWGFSAGGYMSGHAARRLTELGYKLNCQVSGIPMTKPHGGTLSMLKYWDDGMWNADINMYSWTVFLRGDDGTLAADWRVSLVIDPPDQVVANLPPTFIMINTRDTLRDEGEMYANRLKEQGKLIELREYDVSHIGGLPNVATGGSAEDSWSHAVSVLKQHL